MVFSDKQVEEKIFDLIRNGLIEESLYYRLRRFFHNLSQPHFRKVMNKLFLLRMIEYEKKREDRIVRLTKKGEDFKSLFFDYNPNKYYELLKGLFVNGERIDFQSSILFLKKSALVGEISFGLKVARKMMVNQLLLMNRTFLLDKYSKQRVYYFNILPDGVFYLLYYKRLFFGVKEQFDFTNFYNPAISQRQNKYFQEVQELVKITGEELK